MNGHWFCYHCNEVVFRHGEESGLQCCPTCHKFTAEFKPHVEPKLSDETARAGFEQMKKAIV